MNRLKNLLFSYLFNSFIDWNKRRALRKKNVYLDKGVQYNDKTQLEPHIKIYGNTQILSTEIKKGTYIGYNSVLNSCSIGAFCSIASSVNIIYGNHPTKGFISTHPSFFSKNKQAGFSFTEIELFVERNYVIPEKKISVVIGNDVWIGFNASIMEGVTIGDGAIIGAGSMVLKDVPPYSIVVGVPAKIIRYRFTKIEIEKLLELKLWNHDFDWIKKNYKLFNDINNLNKLEEYDRK